MKDTLKADLKTTQRVTVDQGRTIDFMGDEGRVYATPELVRDVENTCRSFLLQHLEEGEDSVGSRIELDHVAPTLLDMWVEISAKIVELQGRRVVFEIAARDPVEEVARGRHTRFVVDVNKSVDRLKAKAAKAQ